jgi:hypothetical protein
LHEAHHDVGLGFQRISVDDDNADSLIARLNEIAPARDNSDLARLRFLDAERWRPQPTSICPTSPA